MRKTGDIQVPDFEKIARDAMKDLPKQVGELAREHFIKSFVKQGFEDASFMAWPKRKDLLSHKILNGSLALKNSIKVTEANLQQVKVEAGAGLPYAAIHNEGGTITIPITQKMKKFFWAMYKKTGEEVWKYMALTKKENITIRIPKRQYIGTSYALDKKIDQLFIHHIIEAQKNLNFKKL